MMVQAWHAPASRRQDFADSCLAVSGKQCAPLVYQAPAIEHPKLFLAWCDGDLKFLQVELPRAL